MPKTSGFETLGLQKNEMRMGTRINMCQVRWKIFLILQ